ncbi:MAG TPA: nucleoside-diphosphate kinase [Desulfomonilia bacterium]
MMERTLLLIKPDAIERGLIGRIISRFEDKGLRITGMKMLRLDLPLLEEHYSHLRDKPYFQRIAEFMMSAPIIAVCIEGIDSVRITRSMCGVTNAREASPGTIRGDMSMSIRSNLVHASDSIESAEIELKRFFMDAELFSYNRKLDEVIFIDAKP